jgi:hypothetical protein
VPTKRVSPAGSNQRTSGPAVGGKALSQGAEVTRQGIEPASRAAPSRDGDRFGAIGGSTGARGAQQHFTPQFIPHWQWWPAWAAGRDRADEAESAIASLPQSRHATTQASVANDERDGASRILDSH